MAVVAGEVGRHHRVAMWLSARRSGLVAGIDIEGVAGRRRREYHHCLTPVSEDAKQEMAWNRALADADSVPTAAKTRDVDVRANAQSRLLDK